MVSPLELDVNALSDLLIRELAKAMALPQVGGVRKIVRRFFGRSAVRFAEMAVGLDRIIASEGIAAGARWLLPNFVSDHTARGLENIPMTGPLVIAANHPGAYDSVVISAYITRPDYKVIIGDIPFFQTLPHLSGCALYAPATSDVMGRMEMVRKAIRHLREGGALLIFARGGIEPDPAFMPAPEAEFYLWSRSLQIFLEHVPQTRVLVTMISGVIARAAMNHPITWLRRARPDRQRLAFMIQIAQQVLTGREKFGLRPYVSFGDLISMRDTGCADHVLQSIQEAAQRLMKSHLAWQA